VRRAIRFEVDLAALRHLLGPGTERFAGEVGELLANIHDCLVERLQQLQDQPQIAVGQARVRGEVVAHSLGVTLLTFEHLRR
jgi:hypothetical protein